MPEIRRIKTSEGAVVAALWDRMCRETPDGGALTTAGRQNIQRMLEIAAWHHQTFCLVAVARGQVDSGQLADRIAGFVLGRVDPGDGLLPGRLGEIQETYVLAESGAAGELARQLVEAAIAWLRGAGVRGVIRHSTAADDAAGRALFASLGFEPDMVTLSRYERGSGSGDEWGDRSGDEWGDRSGDEC